MRSFIIIEVEHGEDTDELEAFASYAANPYTDHQVSVVGYDVRIDLPEWLTP